MSRPCGLRTPPSTSDTATTVAPSSQSSRAMWLPTLPKPWMAKREPFMGRCTSRRISRQM